MTPTDYQRGVLAGLQIGAPAVARFYAAVCALPGQPAHRYGASHSTERAVQLEKAGLIRTELASPRRRLCWPVVPTGES